MPAYLHLFTGDAPALAAPVIEAQTREPDAGLTVVVLSGDGPSDLSPAVVVRRLRPGDLDYAALLDLIFDADHVIAW